VWSHSLTSSFPIGFTTMNSYETHRISMAML
jgi:hypothetical protein